MYRVFLFVAFVALSTGAPYGDFNSQRSLFSTQEQKLVQQPMPITKLQQKDETELVDSLGGGYSFFKKQPIVARPLIQQQLAIKEQPAPISSFDDTSNQWSDYTKASAFKQQPKTQVISSKNDLLIKDQTAYGSALSQGEQPLIRNLPHAHDQQQIQVDVQDPLELQPVPTTFGQQDLPQIPTIKANDAYGQQDVRTLVQQQPLIRPAVNTFIQQDSQPQWTPKSNTGYGQEDVRTLVQKQPLFQHDTVSSYGQQDLPKVVTVKSNDAYGQQDLPKQWTPKSNTGYGQQDIRTLVQKQPLFQNDAVSSYGQQDLPKQWTPKSNTGYGQQDIRTLVQKQPLFQNDAISSYGQQDLPKIVTMKSNDAYGQQDLPKQWTPKSNTGYGQQDVRTLVQQQPLTRPTINTFAQEDTQEEWTPKTMTGFGQNFQDKLSVPILNTVPASQIAQSSWSAQQSSPVFSSRTTFQSAPGKQTSDSGSFAGW